MVFFSDKLKFLLKVAISINFYFYKKHRTVICLVLDELIFTLLRVWDPKPVYGLQNSSGYDTD